MDSLLEKNIPFCIQARIGSSRLPAKILLNLGNKSILNNLVDRVHKIKKILKLHSKIFILVPINEVAFFENHVDLRKAKVFGGDHLNVAKRYLSFCKKYSSEYVWRITSDNPFLTYEPFEIIIDYFKNNKTKDIISLYHQKKLPNGNVISLLTKSQLNKICKYGNFNDRQHIVLKNKYSNIKNPEIPANLTYPNCDFSINEINDYYKLKKYHKFLSKNISLKKILTNKKLIRECFTKKNY